MKRPVLSGFATMDYVVRAGERFDGVGTVAMRSLAWPRAGGAILYAGRELARAAFEPQAVSWVGDDADGQAWRTACEEAGIGTAALATGVATTRCLLVYQPDGSYGCLLQPFAAPLVASQLAPLDDASLLLLAAGDAAVSELLLARLPAHVPVAWIAKHDETCFPEPLAARIAARAAYIFCNERERGWVEGFAPGRRVLFETSGARGVWVEAPGRARTLLPTDGIETADATGAGDTFAGAALAALLRGASAPAAAQAGLDAAASLLRMRAAGWITAGAPAGR